MRKEQIIQQIIEKQSYLCVGLDSDIEKIPPHLKSSADPVFEFNKSIIDATKDYCISYKINTAFYEAMGVKGWEVLEKTVDYIPDTHFKIADAKRGDIGNTSKQYAKAFFEALNFDAVTVAPYMGADSVKPFLEFENKWTILLALTSNPGAQDFELQPMNNGFLFEKVLEKAVSWGTSNQLMFVAGATQANRMESIRALAPDYFLLVPGVGSQGGSLRDTSIKAMNKDIGLLINASRSIIFASNKEDFADKAREEAEKISLEMAGLLKEYGL